MSYRLVINLTILNQPRLTGLGVYTVSIVARLLERLATDSDLEEVVLIGTATRVSELLPVATEIKRARLIDEPVTNPIRRIFRLRQIVSRECQGRADTLFYSPTHHGVDISGVKQIITVHDLFAMLFPANYRMQHLYFKHYLPRVLKRTATVICDSGSTAADLARFYTDLPPSATIPCALRDDLGEMAPEPIPDLTGEKFFLFVGPNYWYKNAERVIGAFTDYNAEHPDEKLVFAGGTGEYLQTLKQLVDKSYPQIQGRVVFTGYVSAGQLAWLYSQATGLMITTLYEGFGLPALEAMKFGCPVIGSDRGALPEVCGQAALLVDPEQQQQIAGAMLRVATDHDLRSSLIAAGYRNLERFDWGRSADQVLALVKERVAISA